MGSTQCIFYYIMLPFTSKAENIKERLTSLVSSVFLGGGGWRWRFIESMMHKKFVFFLNSQAITVSLNFQFLTRLYSHQEVHHTAGLSEKKKSLRNPNNSHWICNTDTTLNNVLTISHWENIRIKCHRDPKRWPHITQQNGTFMAVAVN